MSEGPIPGGERATSRGWGGGHARPKALFVCLAWVVLLLSSLVPAGCGGTPEPVSPTVGLTPTLVSQSSPTLSVTVPGETRTPTVRPTELPPSPEPTPTATVILPSPTLPSEPVLIQALSLGDLPAPGHYPTGVALLDGRVYVCNRGSNNVSIIVDGALADSISVGQEPSAIVADQNTKRIFVLNELDATLSVIEGAHIVDTWPLPEQPAALAIVGEQLWVGAMRGGRIMVLSPVDGEVLGTVTLSSANTIFGLAPHPEMGKVYVTAYGSVHAVEVGSLQEVVSASLDSYRILGVSPRGEDVYVSQYDRDDRRTYLLVLDADSLGVKGRVAVPDDPSALAIDPDDGRIFLVSGYTNQLVIIDGQTYQTLSSLVIGLAPRSLALHVPSGRLYVANNEGDSVTVFDTHSLAIEATIPLAMRFEDMAVDPNTGRLYVAMGSADRVYVFDASGLVDQWQVGRYPNQVRLVASKGLVAVVSSADEKLELLDQTGEAVATYAVGPRPQGLMVDEPRQRIFAGDTVVDLTRLAARTLSIPTEYGYDVPPRQVVRDTRRDLLYVIAWNGVRGSNGAYVVRRWADDGIDFQARTPGRASVVDLIYDEEMDRFYSTDARMGAAGLQVAEAEDSREVLHLRLDRYPGAMALNPATRHLWVVLRPGYWQEDVHGTLLVAYDTRTLGRVAEIGLEGMVESIAVDPNTNHVYLGNGDLGVIQVVQDVAMTPPPAPTLTFTPTPWPTATPTPTPPPTALPTLTCAVEVDPALLGAWDSLGAAGGMGCPVDQATEDDWATQPFERGLMYWRGATSTILVLLDDGRYYSYPDGWQEGMPSLSCEAIAPSGLQQPVRGFGLVWCGEAGVREAIGWAREQERGLRILQQAFPGGWLVWDYQGPVRVLQSDGRWRVVVS